MIVLRRTLITMIAGAWIYNLYLEVKDADTLHQLTAMAMVFILIWIGYGLGKGEVDNNK